MFQGTFAQSCVYNILFIFVASDGGDDNGVCVCVGGRGNGEHIT